MRRIYLDHAATSPLLPEARDAMVNWLDAGNASSLYAEGRAAKAAVDQARETLSAALGCRFAELLFTSGGTEGANAALIGAALAHQNSGRRRVLVGASEHHCVLHTHEHLTALGYEVQLIPVDRYARIDLDALDAMLDSDVLIISVMHANNELGTVNDLTQIAERAHRCGALYHCDAVQTLGYKLLGIRLDAEPGPDVLTVSAHKIGGPKGVGALYLRAGVKLKPLISGGGQEREVRGGTENVAGIVGFAAAIRAAKPARSEIRDLFLSKLTANGFVRTVSSEISALPGHAHVRYPGMDAETILIRLDRAGVSASSGAACSSGSIEPSHVLLASGFSEAETREGLRFTFSSETTSDDASEAADRVVHAIAAMREARART